jgi:hypothetical protein
MFEKHFDVEEFQSLIKEKDKDGDNILHIAAEFGKSKENFKILWLKISKIVKNPKEFFMQKGSLDRNVLQKSAFNENDPEIFEYAFNLAENFCKNEEDKKKLILEKENNEDFNLLRFSVFFAIKPNLEFLFKKILEIFDENEIKKLLMTENVQGRNLLSLSAQNKNFDSIKFMWKFFEENLSEEEIFDLLNQKDEVDGENILHVAAWSGNSKEIFEFLWQKVSEIVESPKEFFMQKALNNRNVLQHSVFNENDKEIFPLIFSLVENFCESEEEKINLILEKIEEDESLLTLTVSFGLKSKLEFLFEEISETFDENEIKNILKSETAENGRNLLTFAAINNKDGHAIEFLFDVHEENLSREEILELLNEKNEDDENILHLVAQFVKSKKIFEFLWRKIKYFINNKEELKNYLKVRGFEGDNLLQASVRGINENSFFYIFDKIYCKYFDFKDFIYETDDFNENLLHYLARSGTVSMIEFAFKKLEENLEVEEIQNFLRLKSENYKNNLLHCAAISNSDKNAVKFLFEILEKFLDKNEIKKMLNEETKSNYFPLHFAIRSNFSHIFEFFAELYLKNFTNKEIEKLSEMKNFVELSKINKKDENIKEIVEKYFGWFLK